MANSLTIKRTHCKHGHEMTAKNTRIRLDGWVHCVACRYAYSVAWKRKRGIKRRFLDYNFPKINFCTRGHAIVGENIYVASDCVRCRACLRLKDKSPNLGEKVVRAVLNGLEEGKLLTTLSGWVKDKYVGGKIVDVARLRRFCAANPVLGKRINALAEKNRVAALQQRRERKRLFAAPVLMRNNGTEAFEAIHRATVNVWEGERDDVMSLMFVALAEGRLQLADATDRVGDFVKVHRYRPRVFGDSSLDKPVSHDSNTTLLDTLSVVSDSGYWDMNMMASAGRRK